MIKQAGFSDWTNLNNSYLNISKAPGEINQAIIRLIITACISLYMVSISFINNEIDFSFRSQFAFFYLIISIFYFYISLRYIQFKKENSKTRILFRVVMIISDNTGLGVGMYLAGDAGNPIFFIFLWVMLGNGIRYGVNYMVISSVVSFIAFSILVYYSPSWNNPFTINIAIGILISFLLLPRYVINLLRRLSVALEEANEANRLKQFFIANMYHELRTPLSSIIQLSDLLRPYNAKQEPARMLKMLESSASTLLGIVNDMLDMSKIEAGENILKEKEFYLSNVLYETYNIIYPQCFKYNIRLNFIIDPHLSVKYYGAAEQIKQVLINLLGNAVKFTRHGRIDLIVSLDKDLTETHNIKIIIRDTGIGIPEEYQLEIFKPFTQADNSIMRQYGGTGLGTTISYSLVRAMGGEMDLASEVQKGTTFTVNLPLKTIDVSGQLTELMRGITLYRLPSGNQYDDVYKLCNKYSINIQTLCETGGVINSDKLVEIKKPAVFCSDREMTFSGNAISNIPVIYFYSNDSEIESFCKNGIAIPVKLDELTDTFINAVNIATLFTPADEKYDLVENIDISLRILIAEDDQMIRDIYKYIFAKTGHQLTIVDNGIKAIEYLQSRKFDIAIIDMHMPELSGIEVAKVYRSKAGKDPVPLVLLSADERNEALELAKDVGYSEVLFKPIKPAVLIKKIYQILNIDVESHIQAEA